MNPRRPFLLEVEGMDEFTRKFLHTRIRIKDLDKTITFYTEVLGFQASGKHISPAGIFEQSFPILASVTQKPFGEYLRMLEATIWQEDEL
jgi:catechol 2,3-dioxygenase-like lactoylglutathione lyase family enzyme